MTAPLFILRPEPGLRASIEAALARGLPAVGHALAEVQPVDWTAPEAADFDGLLFGSANAVRHAGSALDTLASLPAHVVGEATAAAARERGLAVARAGAGGLQHLFDEMDPARSPLRLLRLAGEKHVALDVPAQVAMVTRVVYRVAYLPLPGGLAARLGEGGTVLVHSGEMARHFAAECARLGIDRAGLAIAALAPRIAEAAGPGWRAVAACSTPTDAALLELASDMCQGR